jgi:hypothetical protein
MAEGCEASHELLDVLDVPDLSYFSDGRDFVRVYFDATLGDDVPQELALGDPKVAFFRFSLMLKRSVIRLLLYRDLMTLLST